MNPYLHFFNEIQSSPHPYFKNHFFPKNSKPSTANPPSSIHRKLFVEPHIPIKTSNNESPLIFRDTLSNLMKDATIKTPKRTIHFQIKRNLHKKSLSSTINYREIIRDFQEIDQGLYDSNRNELKTHIRTSQNKEYSDDVLFIKRKEILIKALPARFNLKLPKAIDNCRKIMAKKVRPQTQQLLRVQTPTNIKSLLQNHFEKMKCQKNQTPSYQIKSNPNNPENEYFIFAEQKINDRDNRDRKNLKNPIKISKKINTTEEQMEKDEGLQLLFNCKTFGPTSPYFTGGKMHKRKTQKEYLQNIIQNKKSEVVESPIIKNKKEKKKENENYQTSSEEDVNNKEPLLQTKSKRFSTLIEEGTGGKRMNKTTRKALRESLVYLAALKLDLTDVILFYFEFYEKINFYG